MIDFNEPNSHGEHGATAKARYELERMGEEPEIVEWYLSVVKAFYSYGHSGASAFFTMPVLMKLLEQKNLTPITDDPEEWKQWDETMFPPTGIWQSMRDPQMFSHTNGKTYFSVDTSSSMTDPKPLYTSVHADLADKIPLADV